MLEKFKKIDKKVWIGAGIGAALIIILIIALMIGGSGDKPVNGDTQKNSQSESQTDTQDNTENNNTENGNTENNGTEDETEVGTEKDSETEGTENDSESNTTEDTTGGTTEKPNGNQSQTGSENSGSDDILGGGDKSDPYLEILSEDKMVKTVPVNPGKSVYYGIYRVGGMYLTIEDADAYIIYNGKRYDANNGKVTVKMEDALASEAVLFEVGNSGSVAKEFTLKFSNMTGSYANPEVISKMGTYSKSLEKGAETGHYYKYVAEKTGTIRFYIDSATNDSEMSVTNNTTSVNRTFEADVLTDANGKSYIELAVSKGDTIMIQICAKPDKRWKYPATDITWSGIYQ